MNHVKGLKSKIQNAQAQMPSIQAKSGGKYGLALCLETSRIKKMLER